MNVLGTRTMLDADADADEAGEMGTLVGTRTPSELGVVMVAYNVSSMRGKVPMAGNTNDMAIIVWTNNMPPNKAILGITSMRLESFTTKFNRTGKMVIWGVLRR